MEGEGEGEHRGPSLRKEEVTPHQEVTKKANLQWVSLFNFIWSPRTGLNNPQEIIFKISLMLFMLFLVEIVNS